MDDATEITDDNELMLQKQKELKLEFEQTNKELIDLATAGDIVSQRRLGELYSSTPGMGNPFKWYKLAADSGDAEAQWYVAYYHEYGFCGADQDMDTAMKYYTMSADQKYPDAIGALAYKFMNGRGVDKDIVKAIMLYKSAVDLGSERARYALESFYKCNGDIMADALIKLKTENTGLIEQNNMLIKYVNDLENKVIDLENMPGGAEYFKARERFEESAKISL